jgi:antitoxin ParD1/3/4
VKPKPNINECVLFVTRFTLIHKILCLVRIWCIIESISSLQEFLMPRQSITFSKPNDLWLQSQVDNQEYGTKTEIVNDLIRQARRAQAEVDIVRSELMAAEQSGFSDLSPEEIRAQVKLKLSINGSL